MADILPARQGDPLHSMASAVRLTPISGVGGILQKHVMGPALHNGDGADKRQLGLLPQLRDGQRAAVAHGGAHSGQRGGHAVAQCPGVGDVGVHSLLKAELGRAAQVVTLPVPGPGAALAPILLHVAAADEDLAGGALVKPGEVPAQHAEVRSHGQGQGDVVVLDNAAVGADGDVDAGLGKILVPCGRHVDDRRGLPPADALGLPGDADGAA